MFQYAAGLALARQHTTELKLDASWYVQAPTCKPHERYALSVFDVAEQFAKPDEIACARGLRPTWAKRWSASIARSLLPKPPTSNKRNPGNWHTPPTFAYYPEFFSQPDNTYLHGMFQSERFFAPIADLVRSRFSVRKPIPPAIAKIAELMQQSPSAFVHLRRGDYVDDPLYTREIGVLDSSYYLSAVQALRDQHPEVTLYIFSDDIESAARDFSPFGPHEFVREPTGTTARDVLWLMSRSDHAIIANSTLSWWGAWLNASPRKLVIAPDPWFAGKTHDTTEVVPANWLRIPAKFRS